MPRQELLKGHLTPFGLDAHDLLTLPDVRPFTTKPLLWPLLTSRSASGGVTLQAQGEISPGKAVGLRCTTAGFTSLPFDRESFTITCWLALVRDA